MTENKSNLLFIIPGFFYIENYQKLLYYNDIPYGTIQLSALLKERENVSTQIIDLRVEEEKNNQFSIDKIRKCHFEKVFLKILEDKNIQEFNAVGINCYTSAQYHQTMLIGKILRKNFPKLTILVGGYHPTAVPEDFLGRASKFDYVIKGEADKLLIDLFHANKLNKRRKRNKAELLISNTFIDINKLPIPDFEMYLDSYPDKNNFKFDFFISRGCPYNCKFCATNYPFRTLTFENFKIQFKSLCELIQNYYENEPKLAFGDQSFNCVKIKEKVLDYIIKNKCNETFRFSCQSRIETIDINLINKFIRSRMVVGFGLETTSKRMLIAMNKTNAPDQYLNKAKEIVETYKNSNNETYCRLNTLSGYSGETKESFMDTINFINENALHPNIQISPTLFSNYPNVYVYQNMKEFKLKYGTKFIKKWWKKKGNPLKKSVPTAPSRDYSLKDHLFDYKEQYKEILKSFRLSTVELNLFKTISIKMWYDFYNKWYNEL